MICNYCSNRESRDIEDIEEIEYLLESYYMQVGVMFPLVLWCSGGNPTIMHALIEEQSYIRTYVWPLSGESMCNYDFASTDMMY